MTRITKLVAKGIVTQLTQAKNDAITKEVQTVKEYISKRYADSLPTLVTHCYARHKNYFKTTRTVNVVGAGFHHDSIEIDLTPNGSNDRPILSLSTPEDEAAYQLYSKIQDDVANLKKLRRDIENALMSLATYARIKDQFPEAAPFLNEPITTAVSINLSIIRQQL